MIPRADDLIRAIRRRSGRQTRQLAEALSVSPEELDLFLERLLELQSQGEVIQPPGGGWLAPEASEFRVGEIRLSRRGGGMVALARPEPEGDIRVRTEAAGHAFTGDLVMVRITVSARAQRGRPPRRGRGRVDPRRVGPRRSGPPSLREGRVVEVLRRHRGVIRGQFWALGPEAGSRRKAPGGEGRAGLVRPLARHLTTEIYVGPQESAGARDGDKVLVRVLDGEGHGVYPRGRVVARVGEGTLESDFLAIAAEFAFPVEHPPAAREEAERAPEVEPLLPEELARGREDLRELLTFTIDPEDARDHDDAVSLELLPEGGARLGVHIADVSRYVPPGSALDRSSEARGTSIYLPGRVVPMLPARLSNDLSSLLPGKDRLTKSVFLVFDERGALVRRRLVRSVIRVARRFTYGEVLAILDDSDRRQGGPPSGRAFYPRDRRGPPPPRPLPGDAARYREALEGMASLRDRLWRERMKRGALDLDIPRLRLRVDEEGKVLELEREERDPSHHLVEEFMLAANEAVAGYCGEKHIPLVSRTHPPPDEDRLEDFFEFLEQSGLKQGGLKLGRKGASRDLQRLVEASRPLPLAPAIHLKLLQSLAHAEYSAQPALHFALATAVYCHFTSPIRRYPDLLVHQALDEYWDGKLHGARRREWAEELPARAAASSGTERRAEEAEREMTKLRLIRHLEPRLGEEMEARVVGVQPFGFFVQVEESLVEGLVHVSTLGDDFYEYDEDRLCLRGVHRRRVFRLGDRVRVALSELNPDFREIGFRFLERLEHDRDGR